MTSPTPGTVLTLLDPLSVWVTAERTLPAGTPLTVLSVDERGVLLAGPGGFEVRVTVAFLRDAGARVVRAG